MRLERLGRDRSDGGHHHPSERRPQELTVAGDPEEMLDLGGVGEHRHPGIPAHDRAGGLAERAWIVRQRPAVHGYGEDPEAARPEPVRQRRDGDAVFLNRNISGYF